MPRRCNDNSSDDEPPKKRCNSNFTTSSFDLKHGEFLTDITGKQWKLGKAVGVGGFGEIYLASDDLTKEVKTNSKYVAKVENHKNGPLFVEMNCYIRTAKKEMIEEWKRKKKLTGLGMPHYVAFGSHTHKGERYRFLILPKFERDLEKILEEKKMLNLKTVLTISLQILDVLEYIHSKGYIHSDIKASNILLSNGKIRTTAVSPQRKYYFGNPIRTCRLLRSRRCEETLRHLRPHSNFKYVDDIPNFERMLHNSFGTEDVVKSECRRDQVYLLDYGLASRFLTSSGDHKPNCVDARRAHAGTILFCSRDAHRGLPSRRSDLESLAYNIIFWLTGNLPWSNYLGNPEIVHKQKQRAMTNIDYFLKTTFSDYPSFLKEYLEYLQRLQFQEKPDYNYCKDIFRECLKRNGHKDDSCFDFNDLSKQQRRRNNKRITENIKIRTFICHFSRPPLQSNIPVKPLLRKKARNMVKKKKTNWFEDVADPEEILKQAREKKSLENEANFASNIANLDIYELNPTYAMLEVYNKCMERIDASPSYKGDSSVENINGYTPAMMTVLENMRRRRELEYEQLALNVTRNGRRCVSTRRKKYERPLKSPIHTRTSKSAIVVKKDHLQTRKGKAISLRRTYSLRG